MFDAIRRNDIESIKQTLQLFPWRVNDVDDKYKETLYHRAVFLNNHIILDYLLRADNKYINKGGPWNHTPLHNASHRGYIDCVNILLLHGADIEVKNDNGQTPMDVVCIDGNKDKKDDIIKMMMKYKKNF